MREHNAIINILFGTVLIFTKNILSALDADLRLFSFILKILKIFPIIGFFFLVIGVIQFAEILVHKYFNGSNGFLDSSSSISSELMEMIEEKSLVKEKEESVENMPVKISSKFRVSCPYCGAVSTFGEVCSYCGMSVTKIGG